MTEKKVQQKRALIVMAIIIVFILILGILLFIFNRIPANPPGTVGNYSGNLYNNGLFVQSDDKVYFSNSYANGVLYQMNADETQIEPLNNSQPQFLSVGGSYLYYFQKNSAGKSALGFIKTISGLYRLNLRTQRVECLSQEPIGSMQLIGDYIYYQNYQSNPPSLYRITTNKKKKQSFFAEALNPSCVYNENIYYCGVLNDHYLHMLNTKTQESSIIAEVNMWNPVFKNGYVYYLDLDKDYTLSRINLDSLLVEPLTNDRVDTFNVSDNYVFYQKNSASEPALMRMQLDGTNPEMISEGNYSNLNLTSNFLYFNSFDSTIPIYKLPLDGSINVTTFEAAKTAAISAQ